MARGQGLKRKPQQGGQPVGKKAKGAGKLGKKQQRLQQHDLYEADDSDPDEEKHKSRYDKVENYEYEMPSDYEDEEIDEDLAFTEEDKKKYAGWFDDEGEDEEDGEEHESAEEGGSSEADMDMLDSDQEVEGAPSEEDEEEQAEEHQEQQEGEEEDGFLDMLEGGSSGEEDSGEGKGASAEEEEHGDDEQHRLMLQSVLGQQSQPKVAGAKRAQQPVVDEAYPESEYNLNPGAASTGTGDELTLADLMQGLGGDVKRKLPGTTRKLLEKMSGGERKAVPAPLPRVIKERQERKAGYEATNKDVVKWQPIVKANREAPTLRFTSSRDEVPRINSTAAIGTALAYAAKRKALKMGDAIALEGVEGDEAKRAERAQLESAELDRAKERLTLKHRNTSRWARRALKRGATLHDPGTKAAIADQIQIGQALKRKIEGGRDSDSEGSTEASTSASEDDEQKGGGNKPKPQTMSRAKALAMEMMAGGGHQGGGDEQQQPKKGLFGLPFMARAQEKKRQAAQQEAEAVLRDLQQEQQQLGGEGSDPDLQGTFGNAGAGHEGREAASGRFNFGGQQGSARGGHGDGSDSDRGAGLEDDEFSDDDGGLHEDAEAKAERLSKVAGGSGREEGGTAVKQQQQQQQQRGRRRGQQQQQQQSAEDEAALLGPRPGLAFRSGPQGLGYYPDPVQSPPVNPTGPSLGGKARKHQTQQQGVVRIAGMPTESPAAGLSSDSRASKHACSEGGTANGAGGTAAAAAGKGHGHSNKGQQKQSVAGRDARMGGAGDDSGSASEEEDERQKGGKAQEGMRPAPASHEATQQELIRMAFAGDDVEAEFAADKAAEVGAELPHIEEPSVLPGWGVWQDQQRNPKWMKQAKEKAQREREKAAEGRQDKGLKFVTISEKWDKKAMGAYTTPSVPFPFDSKETYERSIRQPLGRQYNPDSAFRDLTRPAILKNTGVIIDPIRYSKPLAKHTSEVAGKATKPKVLTVAGGANQKPKKRA
ncbi:Utp14 protein-domain-containing protein [Dunaliella salina]|uniref:Utp14 protein-domain-containing protein n=1 Tax=Dunaliella salina TaxID=3046 RepID=A0ABQ7H1B2_DUNSA|nr:Utp14 protein-domain-containing protein [Dunaliella salina]|eukprot:KAF5840649.1 Utp14 protein-domain-containing protein [Dunaliella salina]